MATDKRGSIAFFATYRPPVPLDIYSCPNPSKPNQSASLMTDGKSYNYNGQVIPGHALKAIIKRPKLAGEGFRETDVDAGRLSGMLFVSERGNLETLHFGFHYSGQKPKIFSFAHVYDTYKGVRLEDSGCIAGDYIVYITTKDQAVKRREPWTAVYKTNLKTAVTERMTPRGLFIFFSSSSLC